MGINEIPQISRMSTSEKILFLEDLWDSIASDESSVPVPQVHKDELDARLENYEANPGNLLSFEELQDRINRRK
jgi:putative addiction module component (TIGR02574 family)